MDSKLKKLKLTFYYKFCVIRYFTYIDWKIIKKNGISKIALNEGAYKDNFEKFYKCKKIDAHQLKHATRNPINSKKSIGNI